MSAVYGTSPIRGNGVIFHMNPSAPRKHDPSEGRSLLPNTPFIPTSPSPAAFSTNSVRSGNKIYTYTHEPYDPLNQIIFSYGEGTPHEFRIQPSRLFLITLTCKASQRREVSHLYDCPKSPSTPNFYFRL